MSGIVIFGPDPEIQEREVLIILRVPGQQTTLHHGPKGAIQSQRIAKFYVKIVIGLKATYK